MEIIYYYFRNLIKQLSTYLRIIHSTNVEVYIGAAFTHTCGPLYGQHLLSRLSLDDEPWGAEGPLLLHDTNHVTRGRLDLQLLQTTWETTGLTSERTN